MTAPWVRVTISVAIGLLALALAYDLVLHYEMWATTWRQGSIALGWGPTQLFYATVFRRVGQPPLVKMGMGDGVLIDPAIVAYLTYRALSLKSRSHPGPKRD
ncbi:MAG: hypothetical protein OWU33_12885 [Firmicutes bacterium]|nr:hypothetical protein [Bacillota bacterium]